LLLLLVVVFHTYTPTTGVGGRGKTNQPTNRPTVKSSSFYLLKRE
jgi:hypothetical protein